MHLQLSLTVLIISVHTGLRCPTWIGERPGPVHVANVSCDADGQDAVCQRDEATVPLVAPGPVQAAQDEVERNPTRDAQESTEHNHGHLLF